MVQAIAQRREEILKEGLDEALFERLKKASFGKRMQSMDSMETVCVSLAEGHSPDGCPFLSDVYEKLTVASTEKVIRSAFIPEMSALSIIFPIGWKEKME